MIRILVLADDLTGALDTGVRFAACGAVTLVVRSGAPVPAAAPEVMVVDTETRHLRPEEARRIVREVCVRYPAERIYKKTDSALRGNVGAELAGAMDACPGVELEFVPAFPDVGRTVRGGRLFADGVPVSASASGRDPFEPVRSDEVREILRLQADNEIVLSAPGDVPRTDGTRIRVWDAETNTDLGAIARSLVASGGTRLVAGCAGFAGAFAEAIGYEQAGYAVVPGAERLLVLCGSLHPVSKDQLAYAALEGAPRVRIGNTELAGADGWTRPGGKERLHLLTDMLRTERVLVIDTEDPVGASGAGRERMAQSLGALFRELVRTRIPFLPMIVGGDTLAACMDAVGTVWMRPLGEISDGVVIAQYRDGDAERTVLTKSGGFGRETLITDLARAVLPAAVRKNTETEGKE